MTLLGFTLTAGYEELGSDGGAAAFPDAAGHAPRVQRLGAHLPHHAPGRAARHLCGRGPSDRAAAAAKCAADLTYHEFASDSGGLDYGSEWDASLGFRVGPIALLAKYANYDAEEFAADTEKFWLQADAGF